MHDLSDDTPDADREPLKRPSFTHASKPKYLDLSLPNVQRMIRVTINARQRWDGGQAEMDFIEWEDEYHAQAS